MLTLSWVSRPAAIGDKKLAVMWIVCANANTGPTVNKRLRKPNLISEHKQSKLTCKIWRYINDISHCTSIGSSY